jgi:hypothetical protein
MPTTSACWWSEERLRRLALHDEVLIESVLAMRLRWAAPDTEEILGTMIAVAPISGIARVVQAAPDIALQLGDDLDAAFEELD